MVYIELLALICKVLENDLGMYSSDATNLFIQEYK